MANPLLDALSTVGYAFDTPGAYFRGALSGRLGERRSGQELLTDYGLSSTGDSWGGLKGFGAEMLTDPFSLLGAVTGTIKGTRVARSLAGLGDANPLTRRLSELGAGVEEPLDLVRHAYRGGETANPLLHGAASLVAGEEGAAAPWSMAEVAAKLGGKPQMISASEASQAYEPWLQSLLPEEQTAMKLYSGGPQAKISHTLRGGSSDVGGAMTNPFEDEMGLTGHHIPGTPPIDSPQDVHSEVVPYLDSALSRTAAPEDLMTYRAAGRIGDLVPETVESSIGKVVSDPSYLSTTIDPWGRFYGQSAYPRELLADIMVPQGGRGGYLEPISNFKKEQELLLPRDAQLQVMGSQQIPVEKIDHSWYHLDPAGTPIPRTGVTGGGIHQRIPEDELRDFLGRMVAGTEERVPAGFMEPDWRQYREGNLQGEATQTNVLLKLLSEGLPGAHLPGIRRQTPEEIIRQLSPIIQSLPRPNDRGYYERLMASHLKRGTYPDSDVLRRLGADPAVMRSIPRT